MNKSWERAYKNVEKFIEQCDVNFKMVDSSFEAKNIISDYKYYSFTLKSTERQKYKIEVLMPDIKDIEIYNKPTTIIINEVELSWNSAILQKDDFLNWLKKEPNKKTIFDKEGFKYILNLYNITPEELAQRVNTTRVNVYSWFNLKSKIPQKYIPRIAEVLNIPEKYLKMEINKENKLWLLKDLLRKIEED